MAEIVTRVCDVCQSDIEVKQVTLSLGTGQPWTVDLCRDCLGPLRQRNSQSRKRFHKVKLPPQP